MNRIRPAKFVHVVYRTFRFEEMIAWYQKVFDAKIQHHDPAIGGNDAEQDAIPAWLVFFDGVPESMEQREVTIGVASFRDGEPHEWQDRRGVLHQW